MRVRILLLVSLLSVPFILPAQKLGVIGSSTAFGMNASPSDSSWVNLSAAWYMSIGQLTTLNNLAQSGATTFAGMPSSYLPPVENPQPDHPDYTHNVTTVLSLNPDVVIVAYASNDVNFGYGITQWLSNLRTIRDSILKAGKVAYITTSQPVTAFDAGNRQLLKQVRDSVKAQFGPFALNFFDALADPVTLAMLPQYASDADGRHPNNAGHRALFEVVKAANIMTGGPLPLTLTGFNGSWTGGDVLLQWKFYQTGMGNTPLVFEVQKSADGFGFQTLATINGQSGMPDGSYSYAFTDDNPVNGRNYYRLKWEDAQKDKYSWIVAMNYVASMNKVSIRRIYTPGGQGGTPYAEVDVPSPQTLQVMVYSAQGIRLSQQSIGVAGTSVIFPIPVTGLAAGEYFLRITTADGDHSIKAFVKF